MQTQIFQSMEIETTYNPTTSLSISIYQQTHYQFMHLIHGHGLLFTKNDINITRKQLIKNKKESSARIGSIVDVYLPIGQTGLQPMQTQIFQCIMQTRILHPIVSSTIPTISPSKFPTITPTKLPSHLPSKTPTK
eukprot:546419_1